MPPHDPRTGNTTREAVHGRLLRARDVHGPALMPATEASAPGTAAPDVSLDPPLPVTAVRGRTRLIEELTAAMEAGAPSPHVLTGPGGFGKTTVAAALAERARSRGRRVFWVRAGDLVPGMLEAAVETGGPRAEAEEVRDLPQLAARWVWQHLDRSPEPWLLVLDDADRPEDLFPRHGPGDRADRLWSGSAGFVLVTRRSDAPASWAPARVHTVGGLGNAAAGAVLADHAGEEALPGAEELAEQLGGVPLHLALAGRILATHRMLFPDARALRRRLSEDGADRFGPGTGPLLPGRDTRRLLLSGIWQLALEFVARQEPQAPPLLRRLAALSGRGLPFPLRRLTPELLREGPPWPADRAELARVINALVVHGLVSTVRHGQDTELHLHPLVSEALRARVEPV